MCGIIGYVGKKNAIPILIEGLKNLEYRGYDSAGIAYIKDNKVIIKKEKGKIINLEKILNNDKSYIGIGHTRWATHGIPSQNNAHPHLQGNITLVHNGIIENYEELKQELMDFGYAFKSETDSEVAAAYIDYLDKKNNNLLKTLNECKNIFKGSYAFGIIKHDESDKIYTIRKDSPLIIGIGDNENFIASDMPAIIKHTNKYLLLDNDEIAILSKNDVRVYNNLHQIKKDIQTFEGSISQAEKQGYEHFMLKEINEQPEVIKNIISLYLNNNLDKLPDLTKYNKIDIVACGSAYHAGLVGKYLIEEYANIPVDVEIASEYRYKKLFIDNKTLVIAISQSGETADTLASIRIAKEYHADTLGIVNVIGSSIAREVDNVIYINAGCEIAVATTKAYLLQVLTLILITYKHTNLNLDKDFNKLYEILNNLVKKSYLDIAKKLYKKEHIFFIGRNIDYAIALEGSLKLKEISYISSIAYAAGELKHGSISLIEENTPVIAIVTKKSIADKTISNIKEVKARGAYVLLVTTKDLDVESDFYDDKIVIDNTYELLQPLLNIIPLQILAYEIARLRGCDIDKPRNLAKSVTVE